MGPHADMEAFSRDRERMNEIILSEAPIEVKRFFSLDSRTYRKGALSVETKELIGLACSLVLRCDDCVTYHLVQCVDNGLSDDEIWESLAIALIIGGTITIPHLRRAADTLKKIRNNTEGEQVR